MKNFTLALLSLVFLSSCSDPSIEEQIKNSLEVQLNKTVSDIKIGDTVLVSTLESTMLELDSTLNQMKIVLSELITTKDEQEKLLEETKLQLSSISHPALAYGFEETVRQIENNIQNFDTLIAENNRISEELSNNIQEIESTLKSSGETVAYINVSVKVDQAEKQFKINPDLNIIQ